jgi:molybdopterin/thiamine biosynthesis adenylyltransferase
MQKDISSFLVKAEEMLARLGADGTISLADSQKIAKTYGLSLFEVEVRALEKNIFPLRYTRNQHTFTAKEQLRLLQSHVVLVGCGGIGGFVAQLLAQTGVGQLSLYDPDVFEESNLNRQNFCTLDTLGKPKSVTCEERLRQINPALQISSKVEKFDKDTLRTLSSVNLLIEASDDPKSKRELSFACQEYKIDFLHTALAGESFLLSFNRTLEAYYVDSSKGAEVWTGNLAPTAAAVAAIGSSQAVRILTGKETLLAASMLMVDLATLEATFIPL